jgi:hypothetical protein
MNTEAGTILKINDSDIFVPVYIKTYIVPLTLETVKISANKDIKIIYQLKNYDQAHDSNDPFEKIIGVNEANAPTL